ncbi:MAG TPA: PEGA domain-containing protein, partial [Polyangiaceae bacterium]|nr:PEGA domain-containing protein [Polyangiaceae bacterium]
LNATLHRDIPFLTHVRADVPLDLAVVVSRALQRDMAKRYPDAATMLGELEKYLRRIKPKPDTSDLGELMHSLFAEEIPQQQQRVNELVLQDAASEVEPPPPVSRQTLVTAERQAEPELRAVPKNKRLLVVLGLLGLFVGIGAGGLIVWNSARPPSESADSTRAKSPTQTPLAPTVSREISRPATEEPSAESHAEPTAASLPATLATVAVAAVERTSHHGKPSVAKMHPTRTPGTTAVLETEAPSAKPAYGMLTIDTTPWSNVFVDGKLLGTTPLMQVKLPAGTRALTLRNPELGLEASYSVTILENQTVSKRIGLR